VEDGIRVAVWRDASGNANHARAQASRERPLLVGNDLNGHAAIRFDADPSHLVISDSPSTWFRKGAFTILLVARWSNSTEYRYANAEHGAYPGAALILAKVGMYHPFPGLALFANFPGRYAGTPAIPRLGVQLQYATGLVLSYSSDLNDYQYRLHVVRRPRADVLQLRLNGREDGGGQIPVELDVSASGFPTHLGGDKNAAFQGDIAELIMIADGPEDVELERLERHLLEKYDLGD
jgi:hypothetical protein